MVGRVIGMQLLIPATVKDPERLAREILRDWPARRLITRHKVRVVETLNRVETEVLPPDCS